jgi:hypothetical protein
VVAVAGGDEGVEDGLAGGAALVDGGGEQGAGVDGRAVDGLPGERLRQIGRPGRQPGGVAGRVGADSGE